MQVALRIRPLNEAEAEEGAALVAHRVGEQVSWGGELCLGRRRAPMMGTRESAGHHADHHETLALLVHAQTLAFNPAQLLALL